MLKIVQTRQMFAAHICSNTGKYELCKRMGVKFNYRKYDNDHVPGETLYD